MPKPVLGLSIRKFKVDHGAVFRVYGENLDDTTLSLKAKLASSGFNWDPAEYMVADSDRKKHYVVIRSTPKRRSSAPTAVTTDDDVTITLTFDEGGPDQDVAEEDYDATYEEP